jgi:hydrogenase nickel incorporation protein HypA/HybF
MHEMSIVDELLRQLAEIAAEHRADRVRSVSVETGILRLVDHQTLVDAFRAAAEGTVADQAELRLTDRTARASCRACGNEYDVDDAFVFTCPRCGQADAAIVAGNEILLTEVELDAPDERPDARAQGKERGT